MAWASGLVDWIEDDTAYISVAFSWKLPAAYQLCIWHRAQGYKVRAGGPGTFLRNNYLADVAEIGGGINAIIHHNPLATMASRGCPVGCYFCIVPKMEGTKFVLLPDFIPRPILCDNNLSLLPAEYQNHIIEKYQWSDVPLLDANGGFEPHSFDMETYLRWKVINKGAWRFGFDEISEKSAVYCMTQVLKNEPASLKRVYVLIGNEPFDDCYARIMQVINWGCEPFAQPFMSLDTLVKRPVIQYDWTEKKLRDLARWCNRWIWRSTPFSEYKSSIKK